MAHERQQIRDRIESILNTAALSGIVKWHNSRAIPVKQKQLPAGLIYITEEDSETQESGPRYYKRMARVRIEIQSQLNKNFDNFLDDKALEIEDLFFEKWTLSTTGKIDLGLDFVQDFILTGTAMAMDPEGDNVTSAIIMSWACEYITQAPRSDAGLKTDLKTVNIEWNIPDGETKDAEDKLIDLDT